MGYVGYFTWLNEGLVLSKFIPDRPGQPTFFCDHGNVTINAKCEGNITSYVLN